MKYTKVFATPEEIEELKTLVEKARRTPMMAFSSAHMASGGFAGDAWEHVQKRCHEIALAHGLPEIPGYYGIAEDGEFVDCGAS